MIISGGENVYSAEVENALAAHPDIAEVAIVGVPDPRWGETPVAVIVPRASTAPTVEELRSWADGRLASYKRPARVVCVSELPRNASGKVEKHLIRDRLGQGGDQL
ncbi:AMP-binding enzyme [Actinomycetospora sp. TBRC 11914]|uniref:AMP-binding enzyme n=1 Tax=Actinomycetospora sp. TBRC 11914 TaxID=2729387 RepID=UPI00145DC3E3|nr:hypothetical protein [Actinomycetospora sp. TBRC 11914]NMO91584.1 hypothetical protein [Actinomycetospora sp. TBRC 11914]